MRGWREVKALVERSPGLVLVVAVVCISSASILIRLSEAPAPAIAFYRLGYAVIIHGALSLRRLSGFRRFARSDLYRALGAGVFLAAHFLMWVTSLGYTTVASSTVLVSFHPVFTALGGYLLFKEPLGRRGVVSIGLAMAGTAIIAYGGYMGETPVLRGDLLALGGAFGMAAYLLIGRGVRRRVDTLPYTVVVYGAATLTLLIPLLVTQLPIGGYPMREHLIFVALAILPTLLGHTLLNWALAHVQVAGVSTAVLGEPLGATLLAYVILFETPTSYQWFGGGLILIGLALFSWGRRIRPKARGV